MKQKILIIIFERNVFVKVFRLLSLLNEIQSLMKILQTFYNNIANEIKDIKQEKSDFYIWKYHIFRTMSDHELFKIFSPVSLGENVNEFIFKKLLKTFFEIGV